MVEGSVEAELNLSESKPAAPDPSVTLSGCHLPVPGRILETLYETENFISLIASELLTVPPIRLVA